MKRIKYAIIFSQILKGFATKSEVLEELESINDDADNLLYNIKNWAMYFLSEDECLIIFDRINKFNKYL